ncbi:MAG: efflux RND transporter periplasmic adaptor subunit [Verrucomicrobiales bacterium]|nr:efflux RND transporter periplasmic adaptor subunit [Verrucomicrobiales bacterium]
MRNIAFLLFSCLPLLGMAASDRVILDKESVGNLGIQTATADEATFEETIFALGHIDVLPGKRAVLSSRIPGRAYSVLALPNQEVAEGDELMWVESRQPGDPPPTVKLSAPMAGLISRVDIAVGQPVSPDQSLMEIVDLDVVEALAKVPQDLAGKLKVGQMARIRVTALPGEVFEAKLAHLAAYADEQSGTMEAAFHVKNEAGLLRPGMRTEFSIVVEQRKNVMSIPVEAVLGDAAHRHVYVADFELPDAFAKIPVTLGASNDKRVEVLSGLLPGDEVVIRGGYALDAAGRGTVSLREALDAAHGHPHNEDGTEMTAEQIAAAEASGDGHHHDHDSSDWNSLTLFFASSTGLLLLLLVVQSWNRRKAAC